MMLRLLILIVAVCALSACDPALLLGQVDGVDEPEISCLTQPGRGCKFDRVPVRVLTEPVTLRNRPYQFFPTAESLTFVDSLGRSWVAPQRTLTDGASIPRIFVSIIGDPISSEFISAAAVHDAYCGAGNESGANFQNGRWQDVHRMFYDALIVGGTPEIRAKLMFAAVWLGGPRWNTHRDLGVIATAEKQRAMRAAKSFIEKDEPSLPRLIRYLTLLENDMLHRHRKTQDHVATKRQATPVDVQMSDPPVTTDPPGDGTGSTVASQGGNDPSLVGSLSAGGTDATGNPLVRLPRP